MATLLISDWYSTCLECGKGANPHEEAHVTQLGYEEHSPEGCGAKFDKVAADWGVLPEDVKEMRPDLELINYISPYVAPELLKQGLR